MEVTPTAASDGLDCIRPVMLVLYIPLIFYFFVGVGIVVNGYLLPAVERLCQSLGVRPTVTSLIFLKLASQTDGMVLVFLWAVKYSWLEVVVFALESAIFELLVAVGLAGLFSPDPFQLAWPPFVRNTCFAALTVGTTAAVVYVPLPYVGDGHWWEGLVLLGLFGTFVLFVVFVNEPYLAVWARHWTPRPLLAPKEVDRSLPSVSVDVEVLNGQDGGDHDGDGRHLEQPKHVPPLCPPNLTGSGSATGREESSKAVTFGGELGHTGNPARDTVRTLSLPLPAPRAATVGGSLAVEEIEQEQPCSREGQAVQRLGQRAQTADVHASCRSDNNQWASLRETKEASQALGAEDDLQQPGLTEGILVRTLSRRLRSARSSTSSSGVAGASGAAAAVTDEEQGGGDVANRSDGSTTPSTRCLTLHPLEWPVTVAGWPWFVVSLPWELLFRYTVVPCSDDRDRRWWPLTLGASLLWVFGIMYAEVVVQDLFSRVCAHPLRGLQPTLVAIGTCLCAVLI